MDLAQFKENVALLAVLSEVSGYEDGNAQVDVSTPRQDTSPRRLSLKQESDLVDDLAFISATSEEPEHVIAVCIEEHRDSKGLTIRLARNKGDLQETKHALKEITSVLEKVAAREIDPDVAKEIIKSKILGMNRNRILCRLRSKHARRSFRRTGKPQWIPRIPEALDKVARLGHSKAVPASTWKQMSCLVKELVTCFQKLEGLANIDVQSHRGVQVLSELSVTAYALSRYVEFETAIKKIERLAPLSPGTVSAWLQMLGKLGRYTLIPAFFVAAAKKSSLFENVEVEAVPHGSLLGIPTVPTKKTALDVLSRILPHHPPLDLLQEARACTVGAGSLTTSGELKYQERLRAANKTRSVHAEIKLVFFYETCQTDHLLPRAICSNKSACLLCWLFIKAHGRYFIKRTHGRLYTLWTLPYLEGHGPSEVQPFCLSNIVASMNQHIEQTIRRIIKEGRPKQICPNESVLHLNAPWASSAGSLVETTSPTKNPETPRSSVSGTAESIGKGVGDDAVQLRSTGDPNRPLGRDPSSTQETAHEVIGDSKISSAAQIGCPNATAQFPVIAEDLASRVSSTQSLSTDALQSAEFYVSQSTRSPSTSPGNEWDGNLCGQIASAARSCCSSPIVDVNDGWPHSAREPGGTKNIRHEQLIQGHSICRELHMESSLIRLCTPNIHLSLSSDLLWSQSDDSLTARRGGKKSRRYRNSCRIFARWLTAEEKLQKSTGQLNMIQLDDGEDALSRVLADGAAKSISDLYIARKTDVVRIKYSAEVGDNRF